MRLPAILAILSILLLLAQAAPFSPVWEKWNLNTNPSSSAPVTEYESDWAGHQYFASPVAGWRSLPTYTVMTDRWMDGDPRLNDYFGTLHEIDETQTQLRFGGDVAGLNNPRALDYLQSMGIKAIYVAGSPFVNLPWQADGYSILDQTILDPHYGDIDTWRSFIAEAHRRGIYVVIDMTVSTYGDLIGFEGYLNASAPFNINGHEVLWKRPKYASWGIEEYLDFKIGNSFNESCQFPAFWAEDGTRVPTSDLGRSQGCYESDFDQFGDTEAFGVHPDWQRQLSKFASVQDRLAEWRPSVAQKLERFGCLVIEMLDIDGIRIDKATQQTVDFLAAWSKATRACARAVGKNDFLITGEITGGNTFGSLYLGRGRTPYQLPPGFLEAANVTYADEQYFLREEGLSALDSAAFHYSVYRSLTRFLGMDGNLDVSYDTPVNFVTTWNIMMVTNDFINPNTGLLDPRHLYGATNQDVFRWPSLTNGTQKNLLGLFVTHVLLPGIPLAMYGEEQALYLFDSQASNYMYGRQPMASSYAWQLHGCYKLGSQQYFEMPLEAALTGCEDDTNSYDHLDPTTPSKQVISHFNWLRAAYGVIQDGFALVQLGNWTTYSQLPGSNLTQTEFGLFSTSRGFLPQQKPTGLHSDAIIHLIYSNLNESRAFSFDCLGPDWISTPFMAGEIVRNLFYPFEQYTLQNSLDSYYINGTAPWRGCLSSVAMPMLGFKALVQQQYWQRPPPVLTGFEPGHDARVLSTSTTLAIAFLFSDFMDCNSVTGGVSFSFSGPAASGTAPSIDPLSVTCATVPVSNADMLPGQRPAVWRWSAYIDNALDGLYELTVKNVSTADGAAFTSSSDHLIVRKGAASNPMVFPQENRYDPSLLSLNLEGDVVLRHQASGADLYRYSTDYRRTWSPWTPYTVQTSLPASTFEGVDASDQHVDCQYWSALLGSAGIVVAGDRSVALRGQPRLLPALSARGPYNAYGYDAGFPALFEGVGGHRFGLDFMAPFPASIQVTAYDNFGDFVYGDVEGDGVLDRLPPNTLSFVYLNLSRPPSPHLSYKVVIDEASMSWEAIAQGRYEVSVAIYFVFLLTPFFLAIASVLVFRHRFYAILVNKYGFDEPKAGLVTRIFPGLASSRLSGRPLLIEKASVAEEEKNSNASGQWPYDVAKRRKILIATLEYEIIDWNIKVKLGGLGVMTSMQAKVMADCDLVWVIPKLKDVTYPEGDHLPPFSVTMFGERYEIDVQMHVYKNITYILLDSPIFRSTTKAEPYPPRMDDISSALYYSAFNQCIAETVRKIPGIDIYMINDYHGAMAPLYLLPRILPVSLSLHNSEFQGLWPLRSQAETQEVCSAFNISIALCRKYIQFGNTFNLLHAGASFIAEHQNSVGVAGVSDVYGKRSHQRYPALWGLKNIESHPNPDPSDLAELDTTPIKTATIAIDQESEAARPLLKKQAQEWAGLDQNPNAELLVFVGRWSKQKGVDLIADTLPYFLTKNDRIQLICVGPVIDLYGRLAAEKLSALMKMYPGRVFSKPEFTALPPFIFSGGDFALMPSRDEPFGLVAIEFGRKGALGIGARLGGLGLMPGWWFPVESDATDHLLSQFKKTLSTALKSTPTERAVLRARSAVLRFPTLTWRHKLEVMHDRAIRTSHSLAAAAQRRQSLFTLSSMSFGTGPFSSTGKSDSDIFATLDIKVPQRPTGTISRFLPRPPSLGTARSSDTILTMSGNSSPSANALSRGLRSSFATPCPSSRELRQANGSDNRPHLPRSATSISTSSSMLSFSSYLPSSSLATSPPASPRIISRDPSSSSLNHDSFSPLPDFRDPRPVRRLHRVAAPSWDDSNPLGILLPGVPETPITGGKSYDSSPEQSHSTFSNDPERGSGGPPSPSTLHRLRRSLFRQRSQGGSSSPTAADSALASDSTDESHGDDIFKGSDTATLREAVGQAFQWSGSHTPETPATSPNPRQALHERALSSGSLVDMVTMKLASSPIREGVDSFEDKDGSVSAVFTDRLAGLSSRNSTQDLSIEKYIMKSEKAYFERKQRPSLISIPSYHSIDPLAPVAAMGNQEKPVSPLPPPPRRVSAKPSRMMLFAEKEFLHTPVYAFILAVGQILSATTYQLVLLAGSSTQSNTDLFVIGGVFIAASMAYYSALRTWSSYIVLTAPFVLFSSAFLLVGIPSLPPALSAYATRHGLSLTAACLYAAASAGFFALFSLNFGLEAGQPANVPVFRAWIIQGIQTLWVTALWYFGFRLAYRPAGDYWSPKWLFGVTTAFSFIMAACAVIIFFGLPKFYRSQPSSIPSFHKALARRKLVVWFLVADAIRNFWLSAPYGRNWSFLFSSNLISAPATAILVFIFFVVIWSAVMLPLARFSSRHSWLLPIFSIGLGIPRWAQMYWSLSGIGLYLPWAGSIGGYMSISLWLFLGVLDAVQGVGLGLMLLQTLSRQHLGATLAFAQIFGGTTVLFARAWAPDRLGGQSVFPNFGFVDFGGSHLGGSMIASPLFWTCLVMQVAASAGFFFIFRNEQLSKP